MINRIYLHILKLLILSILFILLSICGISDIPVSDNEVNESLAIYGLQNILNTKMSMSDSPWGSPFGSRLDQYVTASFYDQEYFDSFGVWHTGVDLIPSESYYHSDPGYLATGQVVIYATCKGKAKSLIDQAGALYIYLLCDDGVHACLFVHNRINLIPRGEYYRVISGTPISIMGDSGKAYGEHLHYAIKNVRTGEFYDPALYIN